MAFNETGHYKNVANLNLLIGYVTSYGTTYAPTKTSITLANLQTLYNDGNNQITRVQTAKNNYSQKVDEREIAFKDVKKFTTRIIANLSGTNVSPETITDSKTIAAKIKATKTTKPKMDTQNPDSINPTSTAHSNSRQSFDSLYENFNDLINLLQTTTGYDTNTTEFQIPALTVFADTLKTANENTNTAIIEVTNKRIERDNLLYTPITGLVDAALDTKNYIKGIFGASSPQYKTVNKISFRNR